MATSKNVIPAKAGIQNLLYLLDSRLRGSDKLIKLLEVPLCVRPHAEKGGRGQVLLFNISSFLSNRLIEE